MHNEERLQVAVMRYVRAQYPKVLSFHVANERQTSPMRGAKLKRMGVLAGVPDVHILEPNGIYCGLFIELKVKPNKLSESQKDVLERLRSAGYRAEVAFDFDEAQGIIDEYLK